jgi:putative hydrolase of HD superfamily
MKINSENLEKIFDFLHKIENLKSTLRYTSTKSGRKESVAEHSWRLALFTFVMVDELDLDLDRFHAVKIALVHDLAEALTGDIDAIEIEQGKITKEEKQKLEIEAIKQIKDALPQKAGDEIYSFWKEYNECKTKEAKFIKALDKLETLTQFTETGYKIYDKHEFIANYADKAVSDFPELKDMLKIIKRKLKSEFVKGNIPWKEEYNNLI